MHAPPGCPGGVLRTGKVRVFFSKAWYSMIMRKRTNHYRASAVCTKHAGETTGRPCRTSGGRPLRRLRTVGQSGVAALARAIRDGKTVGVSVYVEYAGDDLRPSAFSIEYTIDGEEHSKHITNDILGGLGL